LPEFISFLLMSTKIYSSFASIKVLKQSLPLNSQTELEFESTLLKKQAKRVTYEYSYFTLHWYSTEQFFQEHFGFVSISQISTVYMSLQDFLLERKRESTGSFFWPDWLGGGGWWMGRGVLESYGLYTCTAMCQCADVFASS
jgi:hypothetical protein